MKITLNHKSCQYTWPWHILSVWLTRLGLYLEIILMGLNISLNKWQSYEVQRTKLSSTMILQLLMWIMWMFKKQVMHIFYSCLFPVSCLVFVILQIYQFVFSNTKVILYMAPYSQSSFHSSQFSIYLLKGIVHHPQMYNAVVIYSICIPN